MLIEVTREDIDNGEREDCRSCPIALAARRAAEPLGFKNASVCANIITFYALGILKPIERDMPASAIDFVTDFDWEVGGPGEGPHYQPRENFAPFSFEVEDLPRIIRRGGQKVIRP